MYARVTTFQIDPARIPDLVARMGDFKASSKAMPGVVDTYVAWRADGKGVVTSVFENKATADAAAAAGQAVWAGIAGMLKATPTAEAYDSVEHLSG